MSSTVKTLVVPMSALLVLLLMILWLAGAFVDKIKPGTEPAATTYQGETYPISLTTTAVYEDVTATVQAHYIKQAGQLDVVWVLNGQMPERRFVRLGKWVNGNHIQVYRS
ncbi:MAG: hypothetical protein PHD43_16140 [Methylococcales bacterium]|nr:hypothetical protein [Methylococcales bacterium]